MNNSTSAKFDNWLHARLAVESLQRYSILPSPENYAVFMAFHSISNQDLAQVLGDMITHGHKIDERILGELYSKYLDNKIDTEKLLNAGSNVADEIRGIMNGITLVENRARDFTTTLANAEAEIEKEDVPTNIKGVLKKLSSAIKNMRSESVALEVRLKQSSAEIENLRFELEKVRAEAATDALTGIANRKTFDTFLAEALEKTFTSAKPLSLIIADIDHFKRINDTWGHQTGDQVICFMAGVLKRVAPEGGLVARIGGEEFAIIAPDTKPDAAWRIAERIRRTVEGKKLIKRNGGDDLGHITVSLGLSVSRGTDTEAKILSRADKALYHSKNTGRNKVTDFNDLSQAAA